MKVKVTFEPLRNLINEKAHAMVKPMANLKQMIWRGLHVHSGSAKSFREKLHQLATAPFHFTLPAFKRAKV